MPDTKNIARIGMLVAVAFVLSYIESVLPLNLGILYSMAGGILSFIIMLVLKKTQKFSVYGVSVAGGVFHNIGQILVAMAVLQNSMVVYYLPFLLVAGVVAGIITGMLAAILVKRFGDAGV